MLHQTLMPCT